MQVEDYPQTHEGGVALVRDVFQSMGGTVLPPTRPGNIRLEYMTPERDALFMDFENECMANHWDWSVPHPIGHMRHEHKAWADMIMSKVYPNHSDVDWYEYCDWVKHGGGDEWFQEN